MNAWSLHNFAQYQRRTALHFASEGGHHDTVRVLLKGGADSNTRDEVSGMYIMYELQMYLHECLWMEILHVCAALVIFIETLIGITDSSCFMCMYIQWNPSIVATIGERLFGHYRGVATSQGFF